MKTIFRLLKWLAILIVFSAYWQVRNLDPEGACKGFEYFSRCWDTWANYHPAHNFKKLPTDEEMIKRFYAYNNELEAIKERALSRGSYSSDYSNLEWKTRHGIYAVYKMIIWPPNVYDSSPSILSANNREWAYKFLVDSTMYIAGAGKEWPWVNRLKGYVYFPLPAPRIEHGVLLGAMQFASGKYRPWRVLPQLDQDWPEDWASGECLLRRIEPQWFLILCKDHVGG
ncbi:MAG: hypothetical protein PHH59_06930 [Methylovulum sp.]|uniref:hypothetical protein n=1 Tax=Methylovulum sp. TaxID=1916980 RepID=UPI0026098BF7|nr:hypothetical protein [Methylovulum sp.]MDD2723741.1 hypothetical protein [Methylovulum sp.]MDD5125358.1 hypothetical protein [Methylovulum sp.]